ncbi:hypothetical protein KZC51_16970 [Microbacterium sp. SSW1-49]|uniref:Uncharacterized protein n=1 Tax=Microbacterium croceum TaxID=2851645 RepID=A0ABT0FIE2_9MICO|nr:hypothetical protein [Microbacterium croceum]MCK2037822.1 hypothetical protein [Microbacterium croceum]
MGVRGVRRLRLALRLTSAGAIVGAGIAVVWFGFAAADGSGVQMAVASAMFAAVASGWSGVFAAIMAKVKSNQSAPS